MKRLFSAVCLITFLSMFAHGSDLKSHPNNFMPIGEVRSGMKGYGMSVFQGSKPERFEVEILGILEGVPNPKTSLIIARLSGALVERTSVFAGMSGSPVYIDGMLVGAVAFGFLGGFGSFAAFSFTQVILGALWQASRPQSPVRHGENEVRYPL